jgi:hypothetical protein
VAPILGARLRVKLCAQCVRYAMSRPFRCAIRGEYGSFANYAAYVERKLGFHGTRAELHDLKAWLDAQEAK